MSRFSTRSTQYEIMDDLDCQGPVVNQTLRELDFINHWLGGNAVTLQALRKILRTFPIDQELTIMDLGCGSGEMLRIIARQAAKENRTIRLVGIDANPYIVEYARQRSPKYQNIHFEAVDIFSPRFQHFTCDILLATLFVHHFSNEQLSLFLSKTKKQVRHAIIINDIHRHALAYHSIKWLTRWFSRSAMVKYDAPLSVLRAFKERDIMEILFNGQMPRFKLTWRWAFRWQLVILTSEG